MSNAVYLAKVHSFIFIEAAGTPWQRYLIIKMIILIRILKEISSKLTSNRFHKHSFTH